VPAVGSCARTVKPARAPRRVDRATRGKETGRCIPTRSVELEQAPFMGASTMITHRVVSREEWIGARRQHLAREKELTRLPRSAAQGAPRRASHRL
jgi:hypothetical protein